MNTLLSVQGLKAGYGAAQVLFGMNFSVEEGQVVTLLGRNGMGRSATIKCLFGLLSPSAGEISLDGKRVERLPSHQIAKLGLGLVPEGRQVFPNLTVEENLVATARLRPDGKLKPWTLDRVYGFFPRLRERRSNLGSQLSGGEQQMLAVGRALLLNASLYLMDEPSEGLAPTIVDDLIRVVHHLVSEGSAVLIVEQNLRAATSMAQRQLIMVSGRIEHETTASELAENADLQRQYLGVDA
jgi:branched-chain amino acid transport system ATP-binding protein